MALPTEQEILRILEARGPADKLTLARQFTQDTSRIAELARHLNQRLYYYERVGLVRRVQCRTTRPVWDVVQTSLVKPTPTRAQPPPPPAIRSPRGPSPEMGTSQSAFRPPSRTPPQPQPQPRGVAVIIDLDQRANQTEEVLNMDPPPFHVIACVSRAYNGPRPAGWTYCQSKCDLPSESDVRTIWMVGKLVQEANPAGWAHVQKVYIYSSDKIFSTLALLLQEAGLVCELK